jgi:hypothetical protein
MVNGAVAEFFSPYKMQSRVPFDHCPVCTSGITSHSFLSQHTNGQWRESKTFRCGSAYLWSPNGNCLETTEFCPHSKEGREAIDRKYLVGLLTDYKLYETYKKWPLDLLARLVKEHERCEEMIAERKRVAQRRQDEAQVRSGFKAFVESMTPKKSALELELEEEAKYQEYLGRGM